MQLKKGFPQAISKALSPVQTYFADNLALLKKVKRLDLWILGISVLLTIVIFVPMWQAGQAIKDPKNKDSYFEIENKARGTLINSLTLLGGSSIVAMFLAYRQLQDADKKHKLEEEKYADQRFHEAVTRLSATDVTIRLAGIQALGVIAEASPEKHWSIAKILISDIQKRSPNLGQSEYEKISDDIQAALNVVLSQWAPIWQSINLSKTDLRGAQLDKADLEQADLSGSDLRKAYLWKVHLENANLEDSDLRDANLGRAHLSRTYLKNADLRGADLEYADLSDAKLQKANLSGANLLGADFEGADIGATNFSGAILLNVKAFRKKTLLGVNFSRASLGQVNMEKATLVAVNLKEVIFCEGNLSKAKFFQSDLREANLREAILSEASFIEVDLRGASLVKADLCRANFTEANLEGADLSGANLSCADLKEVNLKGTNLRGADLSSAAFWNADLTEVNFSSSNLKGADLRRADLRRADLEDANLKDANLTPCQVQEAENWEKAIYDHLFAKQLNLDAVEQVRKVLEWNKKHQSDRTHFSSLW